MAGVIKTVVVPYALAVPKDAIAAAVAAIVGDRPGRGLIQIRVIEQRPAPIGRGPGTELKRMLSWIGMRAGPLCKCTERAEEMDAREAVEPGWCAANIDTIVGWLRDEAERRKLPFVDAAARVLVRRAINAAARRTI